MWRWLMRALRGPSAGRTYEATLIPIELADILARDARYQRRCHELKRRQSEAVAKHRIQAAEQESAWKKERERRWREMTAEERAAANVIEYRRRR